MMRRKPLNVPALQLAPALIWLTLFCLAPLALVLLYSLGSRTPGGGVAFGASLDNYRRIFQSPLYVEVTLRSLRIAAITTLITLIAAYPVAYFIALVAGRRRNLLLLLLLIPWWSSILVKNFAWISLLSDTGVVNRVLIATGLISAPIRLVYTEGAVVVGLIHVLLPFMVLPIYATLEKLDRRLIEAAENLGCGPLRSLCEVVLPLSLPGVVAGSTLTFILAFGSYLTPALLGSERSIMVANIIQGQFMEAFDWPFGSAIAIALLAVVLLILLAFHRLAAVERVLGQGS